MATTDWMPSYADEFGTECREEKETEDTKEKKQVANDQGQRVTSDYRQRSGGPPDLDNVVKSCDAICESTPINKGTPTQKRQRHHSQRDRPSSPWVSQDHLSGTSARRHKSPPPSLGSAQHGLFRYLRCWPLSRMTTLKKTSLGERPSNPNSPSSPRMGSYQDLFNTAAAEVAGSPVGVYRLPPGSVAVRRLRSAPSGGQQADRSNLSRQRKNGVDLGRCIMPLNSNDGVTAIPARCRHSSDHSVSQPVPVAGGGKQRHRSSCYAPAVPDSSSPADPVFCSSCAFSIPDGKSRKSSGSSSTSGSGGGGGGGGSGVGGGGSSNSTGSRIRSFIDTLRPRPKSSEHSLGVPPTPPPYGTPCSWEDGGNSVLHPIPQGQEVRHPPPPPQPSQQPPTAAASASATMPRHSAKERVVQSSSGAAKRPRSPSFGSTFVERLRSLSSSTAPSIGAGGGGHGHGSHGGGLHGHGHGACRLPDPSKLPKASGSGFLSFTKLPLSPQRGGRVRKVSYPPVGCEGDIDVDLNELTKDLRVSLPSSCPGPGPLFHHNNNNFAFKSSACWESMDTSSSTNPDCGAQGPSRSRAGSAGTVGSNSPVVKENTANLQVHQNSKYIIFRDKSDALSESQNIHWEAMSNTEDSYVQFMRRHTCYDLIPTSSKLVVFDTALIVRRAFFGLVYNGVRAAPLWDSRKQEFVGMLTITDFIRILRHYYRSSAIPIEELENQRIQQWREVIHDEDRELIQVSPEDTLYNAVKKLVNQKVHRLPIIDPLTGNALHILTHKRILKYLSLYMNDMPQPNYMSKTIKELDVGTFAEIATVKADTTLIKALNMFLDQRVSALPVVDDQNKLIDIYAKFDVINLAARQTYNNLEITVEEGLSYRKDRFEGVASCRDNDTLEDVVKKIVHAGVHRLVVVDAKDHVVGIVSLSDILTFIVMRNAGSSKEGHQQADSMDGSTSDVAEKVELT